MTGSPLSSALQYLRNNYVNPDRKAVTLLGDGLAQAVVEQSFGQEAAQKLLALVAVERFPRLSVLDHFNAPEETGTSNVSDDGDVVELLKRLLKRHLTKRLQRIPRRATGGSPPSCGRAH